MASIYNRLQNLLSSELKTNNQATLNSGGDEKLDLDKAWTKPVDAYGTSADYSLSFAKPDFGYDTAAGQGHGFKSIRAEYDKPVEKEFLKDSELKTETPVEWTDFTQSTTFHGVRYIFDNKKVTSIRRWLWIVCVLSAVLIFIVQVCWRAGVFLQYYTTQDVKIVRAEMIKFPTITLCNQNSFRMSAAYDANVYNFLDAAYTLQSFTDTNVTDDLLSNLNSSISESDTVDIDKYLSHKKEVLIDSCYWKGEKCNVSTDFTTISTDFGVCFQFNKGRNNDVDEHVEQSGAGFALKLVLNIEQYEYMKGPQNDAGIKLLLHEWDDIPQIQDLGFAIAPGTHSLVGVKRKVMRSLEPPYGECDLANKKTWSYCYVECKSNKVFEKCGCIEPYMVNVSAPLCTFRQRFTCVLPLLENMAKEKTTCACRQPCNRVEYEPSMSYASISKFNADSVALRDSSSREAVLLSMQRVREISQKVVKTVYDKDMKQIEEIIRLSETLHKSMHAAQSILSSPKAYADHYNILDLFLFDESKIKMEADTIRGSIYGRFSKLLFGAYARLGEIRNLYRDVSYSKYSYMKQYYETADICLRNQSDQTTAAPSTTPMMPRTSASYLASQLTTLRYFPSSTPPTEAQCQYAYGRIIGVVEDARSHTGKALKQIVEFQPKYNKSIHESYENTGVDYRIDARHQKCMTYLDDHTQQLFYDVYNYSALIDDILSPERVNFSDQYPLIKQLMVDGVKIKKVHLTMDSICEWAEKITNKYYFAVNRYSPSKGGYADEIHTVLNNYRALQEYYQTFLKTFKLMGEVASTLGRIIQTDYLPYWRNFVKFKNSDMTKLDLANNVVSPLFLKTAQDMLSAKASFELTLKAYKENFRHYKSFYLAIYNQYNNMSLPLLDDKLYNKLEIIKLFKANNESVNIGYLENFEDNRPVYFRNLVSEYIDAYSTNPLHLVEEVIKPVSSLFGALTQLQTDLQTYKAESTMDKKFFMDNFIQMDIFYKEMQYTKVEVQPGFVFGSLLSEIGGFLGLLLGASVLTVCELVDYAALAFVTKMKKSGQIHPAG